MKAFPKATGYITRVKSTYRLYTPTQKKNCGMLLLGIPRRHIRQKDSSFSKTQSYEWEGYD